MDTQRITLFADGPAGGSLARIVDATGPHAIGLSDLAMQNVARRHGQAVGFVLPDNSGCDIALRIFTPSGEIAVCPDTVLAAATLLHQNGRLPQDRMVIATRDGRIETQASIGEAAIAQPLGEVYPVADMWALAILSTLGIGPDALTADPILNVSTGEMKTLVPLRSPEVLDALAPDLSAMTTLCEQLGSTGLYPYARQDAYAREDAHTFDARHFPSMSLDGEDAATAAAAAALAFGLLRSRRVTAEDQIVVRQGRAIGRPSRMVARYRVDETGKIVGCWLSGAARIEAAEVAAA